MISAKTAHTFSFVIGLIFILFSIFLAFYVPNSYFYTSFALGSWLMFDYIDYRLNNVSILSYFYNHKYRQAFYFFFFISFAFCFIVDYIWGVNVLDIWEWTNYSNVEYLRMYLIMNASFVLGMYEFYRFVNTLLKPKISPDYIFNFVISKKYRIILYKAMLIIGIIFLFLPLTVFHFDLYEVREFIIIFPFISMIFITDSVTFLTGGQPVLEELLRCNRVKVMALLITVTISFTFTEGLNLFGREWKYIRMPFYDWQIYSVPVAVLIGWLPLVIGSISIVNLVTHIGFLYRKKEVNSSNKPF